MKLISYPYVVGLLTSHTPYLKFFWDKW